LDDDQGGIVLLITDDTAAPGPEALIEEARRLHRQRPNRRRVALLAAAALAVLAFAIDQIARGGSTRQAAAPAAPATGPTPTVTYEKVVALKLVPGLPVEKKTFETWSASNAPGVYRTVVTIAGGPRVEIGAGPAHGKVLGPEQANYLYDASTNTIFRTGYFLVPSATPPTPEQSFKRLLADPDARLAGTRTYRGGRVYVVKYRDKGIAETLYVDKRSFEPVMSDVRGTDLHSMVRTLVTKTLPATPANVALASLPTAHPHAMVVLHASPRIRALFGEAAFPSGDYGSG
jgi:hypothetical protein